MNQGVEWVNCGYCGKRIKYSESVLDDQYEYCSREHMLAREHAHPQEESTHRKRDFNDDSL